VFQSENRPNVIVDALAIVAVNFALPVGSAISTVTVTSAPPMLETQDATLGLNVRNEVAEEFLSDFGGVLVSDFYSAYDSLRCAQQKCLVHLIRDLNEDVLKEPFNEEMKTLVREFAALLKPVVETIDRHGLKTHFLRKCRVDVARFYERLLARHYATELAQKAQDRFRRNQERLFTFLDHDDVPWNNNNAEHAIKAFADLRNVIDSFSTERGIRDYLVLLSICQTCEYRGVDFLQFLRSGEKSVDDYVRNGHSKQRL
jgi:Transposase IS66 family